MYLDELGCSTRSTFLILLQRSLLDRGYNAGVPAIGLSPHFPEHLMSWP